MGRLLFSILILFVMQSSFASPFSSSGSWRWSLPTSMDEPDYCFMNLPIHGDSLPLMYRPENEEFAVLYYLTGEHALENQVDNYTAVFGPNGYEGYLEQPSGVPDFVEDVVIQLVTMRDALLALGFRHPFESELYREASVFFVSMFNIGTNASGFSRAEPVRYSVTGECGAYMGINSQMIRYNGSHSWTGLTPAHELFHHFQYSYNWFLQLWYLEGLARWSQNILGRYSSSRLEFNTNASLPSSDSELLELYSMVHPASKYFNSMGYRDDNKGLMTSIYPSCLDSFVNKSSVFVSSDLLLLPEELTNRRYLGGACVFRDLEFYGSNLVLRILEGLESLQQQLSQDNSYTYQQHWSNVNFRRDPKFNDLIWNAVLEAYYNDSN